MTNQQLLIGSLSNDLFRVASLAQRGSLKAALRFLQESEKWAQPLTQCTVPSYIIKIAQEVSLDPKNDVTLETAERYLMYGVLLQNYALHNQ